MTAAPVRPGKPVLAVEGVSKTFPPVRLSGRIEQALARLGGTEATTGVLDDEDDGLDEPEIADDDAPLAEVDALRDVAFAVHGGTVLGLVGPPGSGKTALLHVIAGLSAPTAGRVVVRGRTVAALEGLVRALPPRLTMEKSLSLLATLLRLSPHEVRQRADAIFAFGGIEADRRVRIGATTRKRRRQLLLGLTLTADAELALLDVPLGGTQFREQCLEAIAELRRRGAVVVVTARHLEAVADFADRVVYLERGTVLYDGPPAEVAERVVRERGAGTRTSHPPLTPDARRYVDFLRVALGPGRAEVALGAAIDVAEAAGLDHVDWDTVANAASIQRHDAQAVVDRLRAGARDRPA